MQEKPPEKPSGNDMINVVYALARGHAVAVLVFLRCRWGTEALGIHGIIAFVMILLTAACTGAQEMFVYLGLWFMFLIGHRIRTWRLVRSGWREHSMFGGIPWVVLKLPFVKSEPLARYVEAVL